MKTIMMFLFAMIFMYQAGAQVPDNRPCPTIVLEGPQDNKIPEGKETIFNVKPFDKLYSDLSPTYNWYLSSGTIISGQGTSSVSVNTKGLREQQVTITVELGGLKPGCSNTKSITIDVLAEIQKEAKTTKTKAKAKNR
jgi:hypothetical protein